MCTLYLKIIILTNMINLRQAKKFCKDDISLIENYDKAIADTTQTWDCHHRDEVKVLPSGIKVIRTAEELIENGRYVSCPANELIFLTHAEHTSLHFKDSVHKPFLAIHRKHMSDGQKGSKKSIETKLKHAKLMTNNKIALGRKWYNNGVISVMRYECPDGFNEGRIKWGNK